MDWTKVIDALLSGSPWAIVLVLGLVIWKMKTEYSSIIAIKDAKIDEAHIKMQKMLQDASAHTELVISTSNKTLSDIQDKRVNDMMDLQRDNLKALGELNATLSGMVEVARKEKMQ